ncbi:ATP-binding protein [Phenylobacterium aquaticum]|uniref:PAS domain-containing sensor histidine kinase n=1 Tax=Phenylobacterium aquaticum TaxID=1763816 RepID=UPI0026ED3931|nr:ATP-binding protein [Phenylobacterium aquaticum]
MARRVGDDAAEDPAVGRERVKAQPGPALPGQAFARVAILSTLLLLAIYTAFAVARVQREPQTATLANAALPDRADAVAARLDAEATGLKGGLLAARDLLAREDQQPADLAQTGLAATAGAASSLAVLGDEGVVASAGPADGIDWQELTQAAEKSGRDPWLGVTHQAKPALAAAIQANSPKGRRWIVAVGSPARLSAWLTKTRDEVVATPQGRVLAGSGPGGVAVADTLNAAFGVAAEDLSLDGGLIRGRRPDGAALDLAARPALGGALYVISAAPSADNEIQTTAEQLTWLLIPLAAAFLLGLLLLGQSRKAETATKAFVDSEQRFRLAVEAARCGIWEWDLSTDQMYMSDVTGAILGWGGGGVVAGQEVLDRVSPDHRDRVRQALATAAAYGGFDVSFRVPSTAGGRPIWIDARGQAFGDGPGQGYSRIIGVALDVTEERMAQARAQAAEIRLRDAIESVSEAFVLWDRAGRLLMCNRNYRSVFSLEPRLLKPGASRDQVNRFAQLAIKQETPSPDGRKGVREAELNDGRWIQISERRTAEGGLVMTAADITAIKTQEEARRLNEEQLRKAVTSLERSQEQLSELARKYESEKVRAEGANRAKSEFLANMSHELRTPLNAINGFSDIMAQEMFGPLGDARYKGYSHDILSSGQHLLALINDILDMSKIEAGKMSLKFEPLSLEDVAEDAVRLVRNRAETAGLALTIDLPPHLPEVEADYRAIKQVLLNLLSNAIKFTPRGGRITVRAEGRHDPFGERIRVSVQDTGIGIAQDDLARLAQPFEQVENQHSKTTQGTGLGLALTKSLVEMHGGSLDMQSAPGEGTMVSFSLPIRQTGVALATSGAAA